MTGKTVVYDRKNRRIRQNNLAYMTGFSGSRDRMLTVGHESTGATLPGASLRFARAHRCLALSGRRGGRAFSSWRGIHPRRSPSAGVCPNTSRYYWRGIHPRQAPSAGMCSNTGRYHGRGIHPHRACTVAGGRLPIRHPPAQGLRHRGQLPRTGPYQPTT